MTSIDGMITAGIDALQRGNRSVAVNLAKQLADRASMSEDPTNSEVGQQLSTIAARLGAQPNSVRPSQPPPPPPAAYARLQTSVQDIWNAGDAVFLLPGQKRFGEVIAPPQNPARKAAWDELLGLQRAAIATRDLTQPKTEKTGRNPATNANFVTAVRKFTEAKRKYMLEYAGIQDDGPTPSGINANPNANPFGTAGLAREAAAAEEATARIARGAAAAEAAEAARQARLVTATAASKEAEAARQARLVTAAAARKRQEAQNKLRIGRQAFADRAAAEEKARTNAAEKARANAAAVDAGFTSSEDEAQASRELDAFVDRVRSDRAPNWTRLQSDFAKMEPRYRNTLLKDSYNEIKSELDRHVTPEQTTALAQLNALHAARTGALAGRPARPLIQPRAAPVEPATLTTLAAARAASIAPPAQPLVDQSYIRTPSRFTSPATSSGRTPANFMGNAAEQLRNREEATRRTEEALLRSQALEASFAARQRVPSPSLPAVTPSVPTPPPRRGATLSVTPGSALNRAMKAADAAGATQNQQIRTAAATATRKKKNTPDAPIFSSGVQEALKQYEAAPARKAAAEKAANAATQKRANRLRAALPKEQRKLVKTFRNASGQLATEVTGAAANFLAARPNLQGGRRRTQKKGRSV